MAGKKHRTSTDFSIDLMALRANARRFNLDPNQPDLHAFLLEVAEIMAERNAELRWRCELLHNPRKTLCKPAPKQVPILPT